MSTKLYVGNLPFETTETELQELFQAAGEVSSINIVRDRATGQARGFAFVEMGDEESARRAISELNQHQMGGDGRNGPAGAIARPGPLGGR